MGGFFRAIIKTIDLCKCFFWIVTRFIPAYIRNESTAGESENSLADKINQPEKTGIQTMLVVEKLRLAILFKVPLTPLFYCNFIITIK